MMRFNITLALSASLFMLGACSSPQTPTAESSPTASPSAAETAQSAANQATETAQSAMNKATETAKSTTEAAQSAANQATETAQSAMNKATETAKQVLDLKTGFQGVLTGAASTLKAVQSGDLAMAQQEFSKCQGEWTKVKETVKTKSADTYQQVDSQLTKVENLLKATNPDKAQLVTQLKALTKTLTDSASKL
jgi:hypothetical protein